MTTFDARERAFEGLYAHEEAVKFRTLTMAVDRLSAWASALLGHARPESEAYCATLSALFFASGWTDDVTARVRDDLTAAGRTAEAFEARGQLEHMIAAESKKLHEKPH